MPPANNNLTIAATHESGYAVMAYLFDRGPLYIEICESTGEGGPSGVSYSHTGLYREDVDPRKPKSVREAQQSVLVALWMRIQLFQV